MTRAEFAALPFRDSLRGDPLPDVAYRVRGAPTTIVYALIDPRSRRLSRWDAYGVDLYDSLASR